VGSSLTGQLIAGQLFNYGEYPLRQSEHWLIRGVWHSMAAASQ
jgi:hypothetical protein